MNWELLDWLIIGPAIVAVMISGLGRESAFFWATAGWIPCGT